jgi:glycopeptide antibiotics resistance protein
VNKLFETYIQEIIKNTETTGLEKRELEAEIEEHLLLLTEEYLQKGLTEKEAITMAIKDFGDEITIGKGISQSMFPFRKPLKLIGWLLFAAYGIVTFLLLLTPFRGVNTSFFYDDFWKNVNLIPFKSILWYSTGFEHINLDTIVYNTLGNIAIFVPLGFFLPFLFRKIESLITVLIISFLVSFIIESSQLLFKLGQGDIDDILLNTLGAIIGFYLFQIIKSISIKYVVINPRRS